MPRVQYYPIKTEDEAMPKIKIKIMNEYLHGPIWVYNSNGITVLKYPLISEDTILNQLNEKAMELFSGYYEFNTHNQACWFNHEKEKEDKEIMLDLIRKILARLDEINDGTFVVEDYESQRLQSL